MTFERDLIDKKLEAVRKEMQRYKENNKEIGMVLEHLENIYLLLDTLYRKKR
jgi:hypothetical protein